MNASRCSPYPHHTWLAHWFGIQPPCIFDVLECRHATHRVMLTVAGAAVVQWSTRDAEKTFQTTEGVLGFFPCDHEVHSLAMTSAGGFAVFTVLIPAAHIRSVCESEGMHAGTKATPRPAFRDALIRASLLRLSMEAGAPRVSEDIGDEIAARQIIISLSRILGIGQPDWHDDRSVFLPAVMRQIVERIDAHAATLLSVDGLAGAFGLSPGHFARKFQQSTGLSLGRFVNTRRIGMAIPLLVGGTSSLARIAIDLGFSSQSHFTRLFSSHTGMSPQQFRRQQRRTTT